MWPALLLISAAVGAAPVSDRPTERCIERRRPLLELSIDQFDQDPHGGWRGVAAKDGCEVAAAELIADYRDHLNSRMSSLYWHEGQLRAKLDETSAAISLMQRAKHAKVVDGVRQDDWNAYVDATIAFLRMDRRALRRARQRLLATSSSADAAPPDNMSIVDGLIRCFGRSYREAYGSEACQTPATRPSN